MKVYFLEVMTMFYQAGSSVLNRSMIKSAISGSDDHVLPGSSVLTRYMIRGVI